MTIDLKDLMDRQRVYPFEPFRVVARGGEYDILSPLDILVLKDRLVIGVGWSDMPVPEGEPKFRAGRVEVPVPEVERVESLEPAGAC